MKTVALIPARSGSKGVPEKNIKLISGKPLIAWSIEQALASKLVDEIYVSTNCARIAAISKNYGAKVPYLRPKNISTDEATTESAVEHFCGFLDKEELTYENILLIQCTSPVRAVNRFDNAIRNFNERRLDSLISVSIKQQFLWKNFEKPIANYNYTKRPRRQDICNSEKKYTETGSFYLFKRSTFMAVKNRICGRYGLYLTPEEESFDIDSELDFSICEVILNLSKYSTNFAA